jgi:hypothetical protein
MIIANGKDMQILYDIFSGDYVGTRFIANRNPEFRLADFLRESAADADGDR